MKEVATLLLDRALTRGARAAEALTKIGSTRDVSLDAGGGIACTRTAEGGVALRVFLDGGAAGFASVCGPALEEEAAIQLVSAALDAAHVSGPPFDLPGGKAGGGRGLGIFDPRLHAATTSDLEGLLDEAAKEALRSDPRVRRLESASITASSSEIWMENTAGFEGGYRQTLVHLSLGVAADDAGRSIVVKRSRTARSLAAFSPALFGDETARLAATALEGRPPATGIFPALLGPAATAELLRLFSRTLVPPGPATRSEIGSRSLNIVDDGRLPGGVASAPFDGEGVPTRRTGVVVRGCFGEMIHDLASAARCGAASTGNGVRASFRNMPRRMPTNLFITPGSDTPSDLMSGLREGLWIQSLRPTPAVTSDHSTLVALGSGRWVQNGRPGCAVAGALVSWPVAELLAGVIGVGNDLTFGAVGGSFGAPSLLVKEIGVRAP